MPLSALTCGYEAYDGGALHRRDRNANPRRLDASAAYLTASQRPDSNAAPAAANVVAVVIRVTSMPEV
jgi:hypothetical protein